MGRAVGGSMAATKHHAMQSPLDSTRSPYPHSKCSETVMMMVMIVMIIAVPLRMPELNASLVYTFSVDCDAEEFHHYLELQMVVIGMQRRGNERRRRSMGRTGGAAAARRGTLSCLALSNHSCLHLVK
ncbi:unnamed protein product [Pleuronectes platessa]|uniref:Uncharacterized protein n=1 Tax=Pleuronectes platessa TaxID=8262 RepID=A0A9N7VN79_PLEPL|nr:unnamed protein product [Pleuronectes platessa]